MVRAELLLCPQRDKAEMAAELCPGSLKAATDHRYTIFLSSVCVCVYTCVGGCDAGVFRLARE